MNDWDSREVQQTVARDLVELGMDEAAVEEKYRLPAGTIAEWLTSYNFTDMLRSRLNAATWRTRIIVARNSIAAAKELALLAQSKEEDTRRKACQTIISKHRTFST